MKTTTIADQPILSAEAIAGPILSSREGPTTTIWRDGEVWREDRFGRARRLPDTVPVRDPHRQGGDA